MTSSTAKSLMLLSAALLVSAQLSRVQPQRLRRQNAIDSSGYNEDRELFGKQFRNLEELSLSMSIDISALAVDEDMAETTKAPSYWPTYYPTITWSPTSVSLHTLMTKDIVCSLHLIETCYCSLHKCTYSLGHPIIPLPNRQVLHL